MVKKPATITYDKSVDLSNAQKRAAISRLNKRIAELTALDFNAVAAANDGNELDALAQKVNATLAEIYGQNSYEYVSLKIGSLRPQFIAFVLGQDLSIRANMDQVRGKVSNAISRLSARIELLKESLEEEPEDQDAKAVRAFNGLDLHRDINRAASQLYRDGHYANAVESAVKALNNLVRLRTSLEEDGSRLMEAAFGGKSPKVAFNSLADESDRNEQIGFLMLFKGAVAGLRNPRAHSFVEDRPERALEFIAFVSLLAKLLDETDN
ncbi:TIGR02391 family protein [Paracoccus sp. SCN 68-21]|jgi:uncharacterized protein (TIGR02391 family)|uniref:TIGR02391 family protein n=1 Tax=Paracoccus sp. SCN 68-21 TaxID=1660154 RepID=UPI000B145621|nr:TIGR02391 family protein [Paracoccus sp. SCN 68-21]